MKQNRTGRTATFTLLAIAVVAALGLLNRRAIADNIARPWLGISRSVVASERYAIVADKNKTMQLRGWVAGELVYERLLGLLPDVAVNHGEKLVYIAERVGGDQDRHDVLTAEHLDGSKIWSVPLVDDHGFRRTVYIGGGGPPTLVLSRDSATLYVYMYNGHSSRVDSWAATTGERMQSSNILTYCDSAQLKYIAATDTLAVGCFDSNELIMFDGRTLVERWRVNLGDDHFAAMGGPFNKIGGEPGVLVGVVPLQDGRVVAVLDDGHATIVDATSGEIVEQVTLADSAIPAIPEGMVGSTPDGKVWIGWEPTAGGSSAATHARVYDAGSWKMTSELRLPQIATQLAWDREGPYLEATNGSMLSTQVKLSRLPLAPAPSDLRSTGKLLDGDAWALVKLVY